MSVRCLEDTSCPMLCAVSTWLSRLQNGRGVPSRISPNGVLLMTWGGHTTARSIVSGGVRLSPLLCFLPKSFLIDMLRCCCLQDSGGNTSEIRLPDSERGNCDPDRVPSPCEGIAKRAFPFLSLRLAKLAKAKYPQSVELLQPLIGIPLLSLLVLFRRQFLFCF